jgi:dTDP-4-amino-4,6-dideoxy-D-galactose acyltransferase
VNEPCEFLPWDSEFFGRRIARVHACRLTAGSAAAISEWANAHAIECLYFAANPADAVTLRLAPEFGFDLIDLRVTLACAVAGWTFEPAQIPATRLAEVDDVDALRQIARVSHRESRFYQDGRFDERRCDELFATWIAKSCDGYADVVLVADLDGTPAGYITGRIESGNHGTIGLVGIDPSRRRQGCGRALLTSMLEWFVERGIQQVSVVTQGRNADALSFYQSHGFDVVRIEPFYHRWSPRAESA